MQLAAAARAGNEWRVLTELRVTDFRCFPRLRFEPEAGSNFIVGANAQGKTSILEAVCVVTRLQSPRASTLPEAVRAGQPGFALSARVNDTHLHLRFEPPKRTLAIDSVEQSGNASYLRAARVAWFANDDLDIVRGPGAKRRRYLDFICSQLDPLYARRLRAYERALRSRNALLKDARPRREIEAFDSPLIDAGDCLTNVRAEIAAALAPLIEAATRDIGGPADAAAVTYQPGAPGGLAAALEASRPEEIRLRQTVAGPHRDDLALVLNGMDAARFASEGQQRTLALALKLAQTRLIISRTEQIPILLIDDVFGELDPVRRANLLAHLPADAQRLITATSLAWLDDSLRGTVFSLSEHRLSN